MTTFNENQLETYTLGNQNFSRVKDVLSHLYYPVTFLRKINILYACDKL